MDLEFNYKILKLIFFLFVFKMGCCPCKEQQMSDDTFKIYQHIIESTPYYLFQILEKHPHNILMIHRIIILGIVIISFV